MGNTDCHGLRPRNDENFVGAIMDRPWAGQCPAPTGVGFGGRVKTLPYGVESLRDCHGGSAASQ